MSIRAVIIVAAVAAVLYVTRDKREEMLTDIAYCDRVAAGTHTDYAPRDCAAVRLAFSRESN